MSTGTITELPPALGSAIPAPVGKGWRRWWPLALVCLAIVAFVALSMWPRNQNSASTLAPSNPKPYGAAALASVLRAHGINVVEARTLTEATDALTKDSQSTLLLFENTVSLDESQLATLADISRSTVLVSPSVNSLEAFSPSISASGIAVNKTVSDGPLTANCDDPDAVAAGALSRNPNDFGRDSRVFTSTDGPTCFRDFLNRHSSGGLFARDVTRNVSVLGSPSIFSNGEINREGNAALALRLLSDKPTLVWYIPGTEDAAAQVGAPLKSPLSYLPEAYNFVIGWLLICALILVVWRARRLGPLVLEPLPVTVPSAETAAGRARLYENARDRGRAAQNLRSAAFVRMAKLLGLGRHAEEAQLRSELLARLPEHERRIRDVMDAELPRTDRQLVAFARELRQLEGAVEQL